jgi:hypothetical protein
MDKSDRTCCQVSKTLYHGLCLCAGVRNKAVIISYKIRLLSLRENEDRSVEE